MDIPEEAISNSNDKLVELKNKGKRVKDLVELKIKKHSTIIVMGRRGVGKSFLSKYLIRNMLDNKVYNTMYMFSTTERYS